MFTLRFAVKIFVINVIPYRTKETVQITLFVNERLFKDNKPFMRLLRPDYQAFGLLLGFKVYRPLSKNNRPFISPLRLDYQAFGLLLRSNIIPWYKTS